MRVNMGKELALLSVSLIWGTTFALGKYTINYLPVFAYLFIRFFLAAVILWVCFYSMIRQCTRRHLAIALLSGLFLLGTYALQTVGLQYTTASKSAFICGLSVVFVPFLSTAFFRDCINIFAFLGASLAIIGLGLLSLNFQEPLLFSYGDLLTLLSSFCFALQILLVGRYAKEIDPVILAFFQLIVVGAACGVIALTTEPWPAEIPFSVWLIMLFLALFATAGAFFVQCWAQQDTSHTTTAIILSTEAVFGALFAYFLLQEPFTGKMILGCLLLFLATIIVQYKEKAILPSDEIIKNE
jgi:drug/metabolite transporter (DMT)-like permease